MTATVLEQESVTLTNAEQAHRDEARRAQLRWAETPISTRLRVLRSARHELARTSGRLVDAISPELHRTRADSYAAEVLPLLSACRFLEEDAAKILKPCRLGRKGLPFWLAGIDCTIERAPLGVVLVIAPANYPLFLAGVQTLQALAAGNAVVWKPGRGGQPVAQAFRDAIQQAGIPQGLLRITDHSTEAAISELERHPDKIFFTGSAPAGRAVMRQAAEAAIPVVAELSGCDAVVVLESADKTRVVDAIAFGMRLNGSATCMAPRRLFLVGTGHEALIASLRDRFAAMDGVDVGLLTRNRLSHLIERAELQGAVVCGDPQARTVKPILVLNGQPEMEIAQADIFAPVLTIMHANAAEDVLRADAFCPFGLTVAIFGEEQAALALGKQLNVGSVLVNDLIVPTADPRIPFGGRRGSGFGATRGTEGLLEMTATKVTAVRKGKSTRHYQATGSGHEELFRGLVAMSHGASLGERFAGLRRMIAAAKNLK